MREERPRVEFALLTARILSNLNYLLTLPSMTRLLFELSPILLGLLSGLLGRSAAGKGQLPAALVLGALVPVLRGELFQGFNAAVISLVNDVGTAGIGCIGAQVVLYSLRRKAGRENFSE